jgi:signal transduction histidine kinase
MGVPSLPNQEPQRPARTIRFQFAVRLAAPVVFLVLVWGAVAGTGLAGELKTMPGFRSAAASDRGLVESSVIIGLGLVVVLVAILLTGAFTRRLSREIADLAAAAAWGAGAHTADSAGAQPGTDQWPAATTAEVAAVSTALRSMQGAAIAATTAEAGVRNGLRQILASLGKRNQALLHRQLHIIDTLEQQAESPAALAELFTLDHLTTRMRRHAESLSIMAGAAPGRSWSRPVPVIDVIRAAVSEIEDYRRVSVLTDSEETVTTAAVTDLIHLLAELIENATMFSPSSTRVEVRAERVANGFAIEVEDRGLGIAPDQLKLINEQLVSPPDFDVADADRLGLFVTGRLAVRHGIEVSLATSPYRGIKAIVLLPDSIVLSPADKDAVEPAPGGSVPPSLRSSEALSLVGMVYGRSPAAASTIDSATAVSPADAANWADAADPAGSADEPQYPQLYAADGDALGDDAAGTFHGLPRRVRPGSSSQVRGDAQARAQGSLVPHAPPEAPAPEHARDLVSSLQSSWLRSRETDTERPATAPSVDWPDDAGHVATPPGETALDDEEM